MKATLKQTLGTTVVSVLNALLIIAFVLSRPTSAVAQTTISVNDFNQNGAACTLGKAISSANALSRGQAAVAPCATAGVGTPYTLQLPHTGIFSMAAADNYWYGPNAL